MKENDDGEGKEREERSKEKRREYRRNRRGEEKERHGVVLVAFVLQKVGKNGSGAVKKREDEEKD